MDIFIVFYLAKSFLIRKMENKCLENYFFMEKNLEIVRKKKDFKVYILIKKYTLGVINDKKV